MAVALVCVRPFGEYQPGDDAGTVPDEAVYDTYYFAPADHPTAQAAVSTRDQQIADLQAELAGLEGENQ